jgi:hypothetical protein
VRLILCSSIDRFKVDDQPPSPRTTLPARVAGTPGRKDHPWVSPPLWSSLYRRLRQHSQPTVKSLHAGTVSLRSTSSEFEPPPKRFRAPTTERAESPSEIPETSVDISTFTTAEILGERSGPFGIEYWCRLEPQWLAADLVEQVQMGHVHVRDHAKRLTRARRLETLREGTRKGTQKRKFS